MGYGQQPMYGQPPQYGQPTPYGQPMYDQSMYGQHPVYHDEPGRRPGMGNGAQIAMAAAGGLAVGTAGIYAVGHMDDIGNALEGAGEWAGDAMGDVDHFVEEAV